MWRLVASQCRLSRDSMKDTTCAGFAGTLTQWNWNIKFDAKFEAGRLNDAFPMDPNCWSPQRVVMSTLVYVIPLALWADVFDIVH